MIAKCFCRHCGNPIEFEAEQSGAAVICTHCGKETTLGIIKSPQSTPKIPASFNLRRILLFSALALGAFIFVIMIYAVHNISGNPQDEAGREASAIVAQANSFGLEIVSNSLVCPSTVKFLDTKCWRDGNVFVVSGHEDSQNRFGAIVRGFFQCDVTNDGSKLVWVDLMIGDEVQANPRFQSTP